MMASDSVFMYDDTSCSWEPLNTPFKLNPDLRKYLEKDFINEEAVQKYGKDNCLKYFSSIEKCLCIPPSITTVRVNTLKVSKSEVKRSLQNYLNEETPCFWKVEDHDLLPDVLIIISEKINHELKRHPKEIIVDLSCGTAVMRGAHVYAPGILSVPADLKVDDNVSVMADVEGKCRRGLLKPFNGKKIFVGNGKALFEREQLFTVNNPRGLAVKITESFCNCPCLGTVLPELIFLQNLPSIICSHVLDPQPGELVLDMCAAPGGKSTHLAVLMKNKGKLIAIDKTQNKINKIEMNAQRFGLTNLKCYKYNSCHLVDYSLEPKLSKEDNESPPYASEIFDRILLDAPCSALGQRPQLNNSMSLIQLKSYPSLQKKLLSVAIALLKPGGILVYSTCTLTLEENENIVYWVLSNFENVKLEKQKITIGETGRPVAGLKNEDLNKLQRFGCSEDLNSLCNSKSGSFSDSKVVNPLQEKPSLTHEKRPLLNNTIGFFIAKFIKSL